MVTQRNITVATLPVLWYPSYRLIALVLYISITIFPPGHVFCLLTRWPTYIQGWAKERLLSCENVLPGCVVCITYFKCVALYIPWKLCWNTFPGHHHAIIQSLLLDGRIQSWEMTWLIWSMVGRERECNQSVNDVIHFLLSIVVGEMYNWYFVITSAIQGCGPDGFIVLPLNDRTILFL